MRRQPSHRGAMRSSGCCSTSTSTTTAQRIRRSSAGQSCARCGALAPRALLAASLLLALPLLTHAVAAADKFLLPPWQAPPLSLPTTDRLTLVFPMEPLPAPPTPPPAYSGREMHAWDFVGGGGLLLVTRHTFVPFKVLSELLYMPGRYRAPSCKGGTFFSTQRLWVDMQISKEIGRNLWGFPKDMASFEWGPQSVTVRNKTGNIIFSAELSAPRLSPVPRWFASLVRGSTTTIQWPIRQAAAAAGGESGGSGSSGGGGGGGGGGVRPAVLPPLPVPNVQQLSFSSVEQLLVSKVAQLSIDSVAFTGHLGLVAPAAGQPVGIVLGTPGSLSLPQPMRC